MKILYVEPFLGGSHQRWIEGYKKNSTHEVLSIGLPDRMWKWRMIGGAIELANQFNKLNFVPDVIIVSDMLDLATFKGLIKFDGPIILYFHENQITYPLSPNDDDKSNKRDNYYGFINFSSAIAADEIWFNSSYHQQSFLGSLEPFLNQFPDYKLKGEIPLLWNKSKIAYSGMDLKLMDGIDVKNESSDTPIILWNHRWEHDKNPTLFFESLLKLKTENINFKIIVAGEKRGKSSKAWDKYEELLQEEIIHWGFVKSYTEYVKLLKQSDILPVTSDHDYFGVSVVEAIYGGCFPLLPNDLAYPEHIIDPFKDNMLYERGDFYTCLKSVIRNKNYKQNLEQLRNHVFKYDWSIIAPYYDGLIAKYTKKH